MKLNTERKKEIEASREEVYQRARSNVFTTGDRSITEADVAAIFKIYDEEFFNGQIAGRVVELSMQRRKLYSVAPEIEFLATRRTSGYGSVSGYYFEKKLNENNNYEYQKVFFFDICPNLLDAIFNMTKGKGLPAAAGIGCNERIKCFMLVIEHEIIHLLMSLWDFDSLERQKENFSIFGPHGRLFNCMLETYFGHTQHSHNLALEGVYVPPFKLKPGTPKDIGAGFSNWSASCYLDSVIMIMLETQSNFWRRKIFGWNVKGDELARFQSKNPDLAEQVKDVLLKDYKTVHEKGAKSVECLDLRELLSIQDPLMKTNRGGWKMYESGSTYATFAQLFPELLIDVPSRMVRPKLGEVESMSYKTDAAFTYSDFMLSPENEEDYKEYLWDECQSPVLVFTHQAAPKITVFDSLKQEKGLSYEKIRAFGPRILNNKYKLAGVVVLHGRIDASGGGGHYTCYFLAKDDQWYHYNDIGPSFRLVGSVDDLPRAGVWEQSSSQLPTMYFYILDENSSRQQHIEKKVSPKKKTPEETIRPFVFREEKREAFRGEDLDYVRIDRPDHGVVFVVQFKNTSMKNIMLKQIREFVEPDLGSTETIMEENKFAWRLSNETTGNGLHDILRSFSERKTQAAKIYQFKSGKIYNSKYFTVYDYSDNTVAVVGSGLAGYAKELSQLGLESLNLKFNLGRGFLIPKTKILKLKKLLDSF